MHFTSQPDLTKTISLYEQGHNKQVFSKRLKIKQNTAKIKADFWRNSDFRSG